jgi:DNA-binding response OmpR family regulator
MEPIRAIAPLPTLYRDAHLTLDFQRQSATLDAEPLPLTRKEYDLLALLVSYAGVIIPRAEMLMRVWGYSTEIRTRTLDVHIRHLRKKLGVYADVYIETVFGIGHRFQPYDSAPRLQSAIPMERPAFALGA